MAEPLSICVGIYPTPEGAELDYEDLKKLHGSGHVGTYDAAVVVRDSDGLVAIHKREKHGQYGAWKGVGVGALLGVVFPPSLIAMGVAGGVAGGLIGHLRSGMHKGDIAELGTELGPGQSALVVVAAPELGERAEMILSRAQKRIVKQVEMDHEAFAAALAEVEEQLKTDV